MHRTLKNISRLLNATNYTPILVIGSLLLLAKPEEDKHTLNLFLSNRRFENSDKFTKILQG